MFHNRRSSYTHFLVKREKKPCATFLDGSITEGKDFITNCFRELQSNVDKDIAGPMVQALQDSGVEEFLWQTLFGQRYS